jgi:hypothetical protein
MKELLQSIVNPLDSRHFSDNLHPCIHWDRNSSRNRPSRATKLYYCESIIVPESSTAQMACFIWGFSVGEMKRDFDDSLMKVP